MPDQQQKSGEGGQQIQVSGDLVINKDVDPEQASLDYSCRC
jgi:hypothetical protein